MASSQLDSRAGCDAEIVAHIAAGHRNAALTKMMSTYGDDVLRFCLTNLRRTDLAEDVQQQVFFGAYRDLDHFRHRSSVRTWLLAIARHRVLDAQRQVRRAESREVHTDLTMVFDPQPSPDESLDRERIVIALSSRLHELDDGARALLMLRYVHGCSYGEMSLQLGVGASALHARVTRTLARLRAQLESSLEECHQRE